MNLLEVLNTALIFSMTAVAARAFLVVLSIVRKTPLFGGRIYMSRTPEPRN